MAQCFRLSQVAEDDEPRQRGHQDDQYDVGRLLALSDGIFAVAMTLLVVGIPVPVLIHATDRDLQGAVGNLLPNLIAFGVSFTVVGLYWTVHRRILRGVVRVDGGTASMNLLLLLLVCLVPFSAAVLSHYGDLATAVVLYACNLALIGVSTLALRMRTWHYLRIPATARQRRAAVASSVSSVAVFGLSIPIALRNPGYGELFWLLLFPVTFMLGRVDRSHRQGRNRRDPERR